ncbi:MAG: class D sortase [Chloroflexi bacterium]|nr:class D sortase [Anaerolineaceae bacterium]NMB90283.1 class D sortase [Chloroflexota bacterium]
MPRKRSVEDLSVEELRRLLIDKRRAERQARLERYRQTGRTIVVEPAAPAPGAAGAGQAAEEEPSLESRRKPRTFLDRVLFVIELLAVAGLLFVLLNGVNLLRSLNTEVAAALEQPTLTATPLIMAVVLPSGHTPPNAPGGVRPNDAEIPEHLRPLVQTLADLPVPTQGPQQAVRVQIPSISVDAPVVQGDGWEQLKKGVGQHIGSPNPGETGNVVLTAHNDVFGEIFRDLDRLREGDVVTVFTNQRSYTYVVRQTQIVEPTAVEVMGPSQDPVVTLISCYPYLVDNKRIVVTAYLQDQP